MKPVSGTGSAPRKVRNVTGLFAIIASLGLLASSPARADFAVPNGNWFQSNTWGAQYDPSGWQSIWTDQYGFGATWNWHYGNNPYYDAIKAYPSWIVGWAFGGSWPGSDRHGFPVRVSAHPTLPTKWTYTIWGNNIYDASFDVWIANSPTAQYPAGEIMVWLNYNGLAPIQNWGHTGPGQRIYDASGVAAPGTYTIYWGNTNDGQGHSWPVWSFVRDAGYRGNSWNSNLGPFINNVAVSNSWVSSTYVMGIQGGIEISDSQGAQGGFHTNWGDFWGAAW